MSDTDGTVVDFRNLPLDELQVTIRLYNRLRAWGCLTIGDVADMTPKQLLKLPNFGQKCLREVVSALGCYGLSLADASKCQHCGRSF